MAAITQNSVQNQHESMLVVKEELQSEYNEENMKVQIEQREESSECKPSFDDLRGLTNNSKKICCNEPGCSEEFKFIKRFRDHLEEKHMFEMGCEKISFSSMAEFVKWRNNYEQGNCCSFVKKTGSRLTPDPKQRCTYLYCSRSGIYEAKKGTRIVKKSMKSGIACTASIIYKELSHGEIVVTFYPKHYGHEMDTNLLRLTQRDKDTVVNELSEGKHPSAIINQITTSSRDLNILTRKFKISKDAKERNLNLNDPSGIPCSYLETDYPSLDAWCADLSNKKCGTSAVIYYKPLGYKSGPLFSYDMCLVLMTEHMRNMLTYFGDNLIYVSTLFISKINYHITFLFILDEFNTPFPVLLMVSNKMNNTLMQVMFEALSSDLKAHQISLKTKVFMTDRNDGLFKYWNEVMQTESNHMICPRYIDGEWRKYLATISNEECQDEIYDQLCELLEPKHHDAQELLDKLLQKLENNAMCSKFLTYFKKYYANCFDQWGGHRLKNILNIHSCLNFEKTVSELQDTLDAKYKKYSKNIVKILQQLFKRIVSYQHTRTSSIRVILTSNDNYHRESMSLDLKKVYRTENENEWQVVLDTRENSATKETVRKSSNIPKYCQSDDWECSITCSQCAVCIHEYICTCYVYTMQSTMCVHVHLVVRLIRHSLLSNVLEMNNVVLDSKNDSQEKETETQLPMTQESNQEPQDETSIRKAIIQSLNNTQDKLYLIQDKDKLRALLAIAQELHSLTCEMHNRNQSTKQRGKVQKKEKSPVMKKMFRNNSISGITDTESTVGEAKENKRVIKFEPGEIKTENVVIVPSQNIEIFLNENKNSDAKKANVDTTLRAREIDNVHQKSFVQVDGSRVESVACSRKESDPYSRIESVLNCRKEPVTNSRLESFPNSRIKSVPKSRQESAPNSRIESAPNSTMESSFPNSLIKSVPTPMRESVTNPKKFIPNSTIESVPLPMKNLEINKETHLVAKTIEKKQPKHMKESLVVNDLNKDEVQIVKVEKTNYFQTKPAQIQSSKVIVEPNKPREENKKTSTMEKATKPIYDITKKASVNTPTAKSTSTITSWDIEISWLNKKILIPLFSDPKTEIEKIILKLNAGHFVYKNEKDKRGDIISTNKPSIIEQLSGILKTLQNPGSTVSPAKPTGLVTVKLLEHREPLTLKRKIEEYSQQMHTKKNNDVLVVNEANKSVPSNNSFPKKVKPDEKDVGIRPQINRPVEDDIQKDTCDIQKISHIGLVPNIKETAQKEVIPRGTPETEASPPPEKMPRIKDEPSTSDALSEEELETLIPEKTIPTRVVRTLRPHIQNKFNSPHYKGCLKVLKPCIR